MHLNGDLATLPGTRPTKSQPYVLSGSHRDDEPQQDDGDREMGIQDRICAMKIGSAV